MKLETSTPSPIKRWAIREIENGFTKYTVASGTLDLKQHRQELKRDLDPDYYRGIIVSCGAKHSLYNIFMTLLDEGDEVLIPAPYWLTYPEQVRMAGGLPVALLMGIEQNYNMMPEAVEAAITPRTAAFLMNMPSNPTGMIYTKPEQEALAKCFSATPA